MKIKHFAGYGSVEAKKVSKTIKTNPFDEKFVTLKIQVKGNHEWGLLRDDSYDLYHWLLKRFDKSIKDYYDICSNLQCYYENYYVNENGLYVEVCTYTFTYPA